MVVGMADLSVVRSVPMVRGPWSVIRGPWSVVRGLWSLTGNLQSLYTDL